MNIQVSIPDDRLKSRDDISREVLEAVAIEGFRTNQLSTAQVRRLLGFETRFEVHEFLGKHKIPWVNYSIEDAEREIELLRELVP